MYLGQLPISVFMIGVHDRPGSFEKHKLLDRTWLSPLVSSTGEAACRNIVHFLQADLEVTKTIIDQTKGKFLTLDNIVGGRSVKPGV